MRNRDRRQGARLLSLRNGDHGSEIQTGRGARAAPRTVLIVVLIAIALIALTTAYVEFSRGAQTGAVSGIAVAAALLIVVVRAVARRR